MSDIPSCAFPRAARPATTVFGHRRPDETVVYRVVEDRLKARLRADHLIRPAPPMQQHLLHWRLEIPILTSSGSTRWLEVTRPIVEAFFHASYFLEMAARYGAEGGTAHAPERLGAVPPPL